MYVCMYVCICIRSTTTRLPISKDIEFGKKKKAIRTIVVESESIDIAIEKTQRNIPGRTRNSSANRTLSSESTHPKRLKKMGRVTLTQKENDDGTVTVTVKCGLEEVQDEFEQVFDNPIRTLEWNEESMRYELISEPQERTPEWPNSTSIDVEVVGYNDDGTPTMDSGAENSNNSILARECWCARVFQHTNGLRTFFSEGGGDDDDDDDSSLLDFTQYPLFCPVDTNNDLAVNNRDVRVCMSQAVIDFDRQTIDAKKSICYSEEPLSEFSKSSWPLCFFWWIILTYVWCATNYGRRVRGYIWRMLALAFGTVKRTWLPNKRQRGGRSRRTPEAGAERTVASGGHFGEQGPSADTGARDQNSSDDNDNDNDNDNDEDGNDNGDGDDDETNSLTPSMQETIEREFGSYQNYQILDHELRHQARHTDNEFVTWLWYSAVYSEVRRYRYQRFQERRERERLRRRQELEGSRQTAFADDDDDESDDEGLLGTRRLDNVFWWPPSGPDGSRWPHLRNRNGETERGVDAGGNPLDPSKLRLKTKRFVLSDHEMQCLPCDGSTKNSDGDDQERDGPYALATVGVDAEAGADAEAGNNDGTDVDFNNSDTEVFENSCPICFGELEEGDWVGDIPCGHVFHKDCLKEWLRKNNHCPVCRAPNIASHPVLVDNEQKREEETSTTGSVSAAAVDVVAGSEE
jgi:hypothetical protein